VVSLALVSRRIPRMNVVDRMLDSGGVEPGINRTACCVAAAAASTRAARSSSLAPLDGYAALAAPRQALGGASGDIKERTEASRHPC
jgi:hypothetical protein